MRIPGVEPVVVSTKLVAVSLAVLLPASIPLSANGPATVSPGRLDAIAEIHGRCPTFSWSIDHDADAYEIVVYEMTDTMIREEIEVDTRPELALRTIVRGAAASWTPTAHQCLERGTEYFWLVRSIGDEGAGQWSPARLFSIPAKPSVEEVEEALDVLREFLSDERSGPRTASAIADVEKSLSPVSAAAIDAQQSELRAPVPTETAGIVSDIDSATLTAYAMRAITRSDETGSAGVYAEATAGNGFTYGVLAENHSADGAGIEGRAWSPIGRTAGVRGFAVSPNGYAGLFETQWSGTGGVYASAATNAYSDLVLGGTSSTNDDGTIRSDPDYGGSDIFIDAKDAVVVRLDYDGTGSDPDNDFWVQNSSGTNLFNVDESGQVSISGNLSVSGSVSGSLVDQSDIDAALLTHENHYHPLRIFVTSTTYQGNLGGLGGGDSKCQARASAAGLPGAFKAWLSGNETTNEARDRLNHSTRPYYLPSGHKVADNWNDLVDGSLDHAINYNEFGNQVTTSTTAYTNTTSSGGRYTNTTDCGPSATEWTSSSEFESGRYGSITSTTGSWTSSSNTGCNNWRRLYCLQQ